MRLIDADELVARVMQIRNTDVGNGTLASWCLDTILRFVDEATTVDAVEVVRCKDCKFNYANQIPSEDACQLCVELPISDEFYCAYGEREEDEVTECTTHT